MVNIISYATLNDNVHNLSLENMPL